MEKLKKIIKCVGEYIPTMTVTDLALVKLCLLAAGLLWGLACPKKLRKPVMTVAVILFIATYIPAMTKFLFFAGERINSED